VNDVSAPHVNELYCEENPPVPLTADDLLELHALIPRVYAGHRISPQAAVNRYLFFVGEGLRALDAWRSGRTATSQKP
jgi:hypothetical protein